MSIKNIDGTTANFPLTAGKTPLFNPSIVPAGYYLYVTSAFDLVEDPPLATVAEINADATPEVGTAFELSDAGDLTLGGLSPTTALPVVIGNKVLFEGGQWWIYTMPSRGIGPQVALEQDGPGKTVVAGQFLDHVYILGGAISDSPAAEPGDWISMHAYAPASTPASVAAGTGNAVWELYGGPSRLKPDNVNGDRVVDGLTMKAGEINLNLSPVPNPYKAGYWNWDPTKSPSITPVDDPSAPDGTFDLFNVNIPLVRQANRISLMIGGDITPDSLKGKKMLPHWILVFTVMRAKAAGLLKATARMTTARLKTV